MREDSGAALVELTREIVPRLPATWSELVWPQGFTLEDTEQSSHENRKMAKP